MGSTTTPVKRLSSLPAPLSAKRQHGRVINSVADYLRMHLRVPNVYLEPAASILKSVDVLAVDGAGSGDIHCAEIKLLPAPMTSLAIRNYIEQVKSVPAHFKYVVMRSNATALALGTQLFSNDGIGRIGLFFISELDESLPKVELVIKPERFRMHETDLAKVERYLNGVKPDIFVRI